VAFSTPKVFCAARKVELAASAVAGDAVDDQRAREPPSRPTEMHRGRLDADRDLDVFLVVPSVVQRDDRAELVPPDVESDRRCFAAARGPTKRPLRLIEKSLPNVLDRYCQRTFDGRLALPAPPIAASLPADNFPLTPGRFLPKSIVTVPLDVMPWRGRHNVSLGDQEPAQCEFIRNLSTLAAGAEFSDFVLYSFLTCHIEYCSVATEDWVRRQLGGIWPHRRTQPQTSLGIGTNCCIFTSPWRNFCR
jgi:hypothetical protein